MAKNLPTASARTGNHSFDKVCTANGIEYRLITPRHPQTNGMVERFNGRISEVLATTRFDCKKSLKDNLLQYAEVYNNHIPQKTLDTCRQSKQ